MPLTPRVLLTTGAVLALLALSAPSSAAHAALIPEGNTLANSARGSAMRGAAGASGAPDQARPHHTKGAMMLASGIRDHDIGGNQGAGEVGVYSPYVMAHDAGYDARLVAALAAAPTPVLRRFLADRGATCAGCLDRESLVDAALRARRLPTADDATAAAMSLGEDWAASRLALRAPEADGVTSTDSLFEAEVAGAFFDGEVRRRGASDYGLTGLPVGAVAGGVANGGNGVLGALTSLLGFNGDAAATDMDRQVAAGVNSNANENRNTDPRSRDSVLRALSDEEVASLVQIMDLRNQVDLGRVRCTASATNSTQFCVPVGATVTRMVTPFADM